jgi:uncharacterized protein involved in tolerance to divalent cations
MPIVVFTTIDTAEAADRFVRSAVEAGLAACNQIEKIRSLVR